MQKRMLAYIALFVIAICQGLPVYAIPPTQQSATVNIAATDTTINFNGSFSHVIIKTSTAAAIVYVNLNNGTATTANFQIDPGSSLTYGMADGNAMTGFHYIGASATGTLSWMAW